ncbi:MAG: peptidase M14 [Pirellulales bacterium]|nr:peptidase M14 [Pirellulales bacterium]
MVTTLFLGLLWLASAALAANDNQQVYQPMGAPADPKVPARWNRYCDYQQATDLLKAMAAAHPQRAKLASLGKSYGGRQMWLLTVTNFDTGADHEKPAFWIDGAIHGNELQAVEVSLYTAWYLLEMYGRNAFVTRLLDERAFYIVPMMNPDSRVAHMVEPNTTHSPRSGQQPVDDDRDGLVDEDGYDDLNGDGQITQMRIRDPIGRWKPHPEFPQLMIQAEADQPGEYRLLGLEGIDNDGDGRVNEDGDGSYDLNRNWPWQWQPGYANPGAHWYPFALAEIRAVGDFVLDHPNIAGAQSYHNAGGLILRGPGVKESPYEKADLEVFAALGKRGELVLPRYKYTDVAEGLYEVYGGELDWFYAMRGVFAFTNELFTAFNYFREPAEGFFGKPEQLERFNKYLLFGQGTVPWQDVEHPQYGNIEVGGLKKQWTRQPPSFLLEEECHRNMAFTLYHADQMPMVEIRSAEVKKLSEDLFQVTAVVANPKLVPTHSAVDLKRKITPPDLVSLHGKNLKVIAGMWTDEPFFEKAEKATQQKVRPEELRVPNIPGMQAVYVRWILEGAGPYTVKVRSVKGGRDQRRAK